MIVTESKVYACVCLVLVICTVSITVGVLVGGKHGSKNSDSKVGEPPPSSQLPPLPAEEDAPIASLPANEECIYQLSPNESEFIIDALYLNGQRISKTGIVTAIPGDRVRVTGEATTCSSSFYICPTCVTQLYLTLMNAGDGSLYDPCTYFWAGQAVGEDFTGAEGEPYLIRPSLDMTSKCFDTRSNGDCGYADFDEEFVLDGSGRFAFVLSVTYQYQCQQYLEENKLKILGVSDDFALEIGNDTSSSELSGSGGSYVVDSKVNEPLPLTTTQLSPPTVDGDVLAASPNSVSYSVGSSRVADTSDHESTCRDEFGSEWGVADWDYDLKALGGDALLQLMNGLGIYPINSDMDINEPRWYDGYFVTRSGLKNHLGGSRVYNFHYIMGGAPSWFVVHETLAKDIYLGSWFDMERYILCKKPLPGQPSSQLSSMPSSMPSQQLLPPLPAEEDAPIASLPANEECIYQLSPNESEFLIDALYLNGQRISKTGIVTAIPGDRVRVTGEATTCSSSFCPGCVTQLYLTLMNAGDGSLYDPCTYFWAGQVVGEDFPGAEGEPYLIRPSLDMTSKCFDTRSNGDCGYADFDEEFVLDSSGRFAFVLSVTYQYQCQQYLEENKLKILGVSDDFALEIGNDTSSSELSGSGGSYVVDSKFNEPPPLTTTQLPELVMNICGIPGGTTEFSSNDSGHLYVVSLTSDSVKGPLNGSFKQQLDAFTVGTFSRFEGNDAIFEEGSYCGAIRAPRSGTVQFIEDCDAAELTIQSVTEPSTCVYKMVVSGLCGENDTPYNHGSSLLNTAKSLTIFASDSDSDSTWYSVSFEPGGVFKQTNEVLVGLVTETDDFEVTFEEGSYCGAISAPRSGTVQFIKDCAAEEPTVTVTEPDTCFYEMEVNGVCACGDEDE